MQESDAQFRDRVFHNRRGKTEIPAEFAGRLMAVLSEIEEATKERFQLTLRMAHSDSEIILNPFEERGPFAVSEMRPGYEGLNGVYANMDAVRETVLRLRYGTYLQPDLATWACPKCGISRTEEPCKRNFTLTSVYGDICQFCHHTFTSVWDKVDFCLSNGLVYKGGGGSLSICHPIGKITLQ